jgi:hypothetical protein
VVRLQVGFARRRRHPACLFLSGEIPEEQLVALLRGNPAQVAAAVRMVSDRRLVADVTLFAFLATNVNAVVEAAVAAALADWVAPGVGGPAPLELLKSILSEPGVRLAARIAGSISQQRNLVEQTSCWLF